MNIKINENTNINISLTMLLGVVSVISAASWAVYAANTRIVDVEKEIITITSSRSDVRKLLEAQQASIASLREQTHGLEKQNQFILQMLDN